MEDFKSWSLDRLIDLWVDMATPDFGNLPVTDMYPERKLGIVYIISEKIGLSYMDVMVLLNTKRVGKEVIGSIMKTKIKIKNQILVIVKS